MNVEKYLPEKCYSGSGSGGLMDECIKICKEHLLWIVHENTFFHKPNRASRFGDNWGVLYLNVSNTL